MKKLLINSLMALTLSAASGAVFAADAPKTTQPAATASQPSKTLLHGEWRCEMPVESINLLNMDRYVLNADGTLENEAIVAFPLRSPILVYSNNSKGKWALDGDKLTFTLSEQSDFKRETDMAKVKQHFKAEDIDTLEKVDAQLLPDLNKSKQDSYSVKIMEQSDKHFVFAVPLSEKEVAYGQCLNKAGVEHLQALYEAERAEAEKAEKAKAAKASSSSKSTTKKK